MTSAAWLAAGALGLAACRGNEGPRYLLWRIAGADSDVYLLGSVHVLRPADRLGGPAFERAYAAAQSVVMELDFDDVADSQLGDIMASMATDSGGLVENLGEDGYAQARDQAAEIGLDLEPLRRTEPWFAALGVTNMMLARLGFDPAHGVEAEVTVRARADGKPITGLETPEFQIGLFDGMPPDQQRALLFKSIEEAEQMPAQIETLIAAWTRGDERALHAELVTGFEQFPGLYRTLVEERNDRWVPQIVALLQGHEDHLVIVGALHLIGEGSVIDLLAQRGYRAERL